MTRTHLGIAVAVLLTVVLVQTIALMQTPTRPTATQTSQRSDRETVSKRLEKFGAVKDVTFDEQAGLYRARVGNRFVYTTADGKYLLSGPLFDLKTRDNLTEQAQAGIRRERLSKLDADEAITFAPDGQRKAVVYVFTDITCPYCQKFHRQIDAYTARGIEVRYLAFPRGGPNSEGWRLAESVWCANDRTQALTNAKQTQSMASASGCNDAPIRAQYQAGRAMGLRGTPMIVTRKGRKFGGYLPPQKLAARLDISG